MFDFSQFSGEGVDLVHIAFDNKGNDRDSAIAEGQALAGQNNVCVLGNGAVDLWCYRAVLDQYGNGSNSLFHQCYFWIR